MARFSRRVDNQLRRGQGTVNRIPRILNVDTGVRSLGYTEANTDATTAFSRVKTSKAVFSGSTDIVEGSLIQDADDGKYYLVMGAKRVRNYDEIAYVDATLLWAHAVCDLYRFESGTKNAFGRAADPAPVLKYPGIRVTTSSVAIDANEQEDRSLPKDKIKLYLQDKYEVQENDQIVTGSNTYRVVQVAPDELNGLLLLYVEVDKR